MGNQVSQNICVVDSQHRMSISLPENLRQTMLSMLTSLHNTLEDEKKELATADFEVIISAIGNAPIADIENEFFQLCTHFQENVTFSSEHFLGSVGNVRVFLSKEVASYANSYCEAIIVDDIELARLLKEFPDTEKCLGSENQNVIAFNVPSGTHINPKTHASTGDELPFMWKNTSAPPFKLIGTAAEDGEIHLEDGVDSNSTPAIMLQKCAEILNKP